MSSAFRPDTGNPAALNFSFSTGTVKSDNSDFDGDDLIVAGSSLIVIPSGMASLAILIPSGISGSLLVMLIPSGISLSSLDMLIPSGIDFLSGTF